MSPYQPSSPGNISAMRADGAPVDNVYYETFPWSWSQKTAHPECRFTWSGQYRSCPLGSEVSVAFALPALVFQSSRDGHGTMYGMRYARRYESAIVNKSSANLQILADQRCVSRQENMLSCPDGLEKPQEA